MNKYARHRSDLQALRSEDEWTNYLLRESALPGPRANLELVAAAADEADPDLLRRLASLAPGEAPAGTAFEFLPVCGAVGLGRLLAEGTGGAGEVHMLRTLASDPRWRVREGAAMALQRFGDADFPGMLAVAREWSRGSPYEQRAAAAGLCEPRLLRSPERAAAVLAVLDGITASIPGTGDRRGDDFKALRKGLAYCWSVAVAAHPEAGKPAFERWLGSADPDIRWIMKQNLGKARLERMEASWVERCQNLLVDPSGGGRGKVDAGA